MRQHNYSVAVQWMGNTGQGTTAYNAYSRNHIISSEGKQAVECSSDPAFRGDKTRYNPEELLVASLSSCHMLWYLHLCANAGIVVVDYCDSVTGTMVETEDGGGHFTEVVLHPIVTIVDEAMSMKANELHTKAHALCFIANSVNFPVRHEAKCVVAAGST